MTTEQNWKLIKLTAEALAAASRGDADEANDLAERAADAGSLLGVAMSTYLRTSHRPGVYDQPAAFEAFISGGGNIALYERTSAALAACYPGVGSLLDIGCGNGRALIPALQQSPTVPSTIDLVEPAADLMSHCLGAFAQTRLPVTTTAWQVGLTDFLASAPADQRWELAQSTFALQSIEPTERQAALRSLAQRVDRIVVVDFDVPGDEPGSRQQLRRLAANYERGLAEYDDTRELVAQGFLLPVLLGQLSGSTPRTNWEQPAENWRAEFKAAGFQDIDVQPLADYWSAPAFVMTARGVQEQTAWDSGDRMTLGDWGRQARLNDVHERLREVSNSELGGPTGEHISGRIDLQRDAVEVWWCGPVPAQAQAVIDRAWDDGITVELHPAPFRRAQLDATRQHIMAGTKQTDIGLGMILHNNDGSGFTVHFRTSPQAMDAIAAVDRIRAAAALGQHPAPEDQAFAALYAVTGPSIIVSLCPLPNW